MKCNIQLPKSEQAAEIIGIVMGDGWLYLDKKRKYPTIFAFHNNETSYMYYVKKLVEKHFAYNFCITEIENEVLLRNNSVYVGNQLIHLGFLNGNKIKNKIQIPD